MEHLGHVWKAEVVSTKMTINGVFELLMFRELLHLLIIRVLIVSYQALILAVWIAWDFVFIWCSPYSCAGRPSYFTKIAQKWSNYRLYLTKESPRPPCLEKLLHLEPFSWTISNLRFLVYCQDLEIACDLKENITCRLPKLFSYNTRAVKYFVVNLSKFFFPVIPVHQDAYQSCLGEILSWHFLHHWHFHTLYIALRTMTHIRSIFDDRHQPLKHWPCLPFFLFIA